MKLGTETHKELFCRSFMESHLRYEPSEYGVKVGEPSAINLPQNIEQNFTHFGFEECLDSFFAFGLFAVAREACVFPEQIFTIFDPILDEEARHIVFFVNWFTYQQIKYGQRFAGLRAIPTLWHYGIAFRSLLDAVGKGGTSGDGFKE